MNPVDFGQYLRSLRTNKKMTIRQLELYSGVSNAYLSHLENGRRGLPSPDILKKLHKPLGVTYEDLMEKAGHLDVKHVELDSVDELIKDVESLSLEEVLLKYNLMVDGKELTEEEARSLLAFVRTNRSLSESIKSKD